MQATRRCCTAALTALLAIGIAPAAALALPSAQTLSQALGDSGDRSGAATWGRLADGTPVLVVDGEVVRNRRIVDPESGAAYWLGDDGAVARDEAYFDPITQAWYWAGPDGVSVTDTEIQIPGTDATIRLDALGRRVSGKVSRYSLVDGRVHTCYYDPATGERRTGFIYIPEESTWNYFEPENGWMLTGEQRIDGSVYHFDTATGAMTTGWHYSAERGGWVYFDPDTGRMVHGQRMIDGAPRYLDDITGVVLTERELVARLLEVVEASYFTHPATDDELAAAGGEVCPHGPCMSYVWWCFHHAGLDIFLSDGENLSGWPHDQLDWYEERDLADLVPEVGDIIFFRYDGFATAEGLSASHAGIVVGFENGNVLVADAAFSSIEPREYPIDEHTAGIAHPRWNG